MKQRKAYSLLCLVAFLALIVGCTDDSLRGKQRTTTTKNSTGLTSERVIAQAAPAGTVVVYQHCNYGGYKVTLPVGTYTMTALSSRGVRNDDISSIEVATGYRAILYADNNFSGASTTRTTNSSCLTGIGWNDRISSMKVEKIPTTTTWRKANLTNFTSYPDPGSEECIEYNGCLWAGYFAFVSGKQPESWVQANNIIAVHSKDAGTYKLKTLRIRQGTRQIDAKVYDMCSDSDCNGCCTANCAETGFLIDMEKYTMQRFGSGSGIVEWTCLDCN